MSATTRRAIRRSQPTTLRGGASALLDEIIVPQSATEVLVHVRDYTKGHPTVAANNHPIRHGAVIGIHNGVILNDDELLAKHDCARREPGMTVDSEAIFAVAAHSRSDARALEALEGAMAAAWLDERDAGVLHLARGVGRPLWLGQGQDGIFFASTKLALEVLEHYCAISLRKRQVREGTLFTLCEGRIAAQARFKPKRYVEAEPLPAVRAPGERENCLSRLAALAAT